MWVKKIGERLGCATRHIRTKRRLHLLSEIRTMSSPKNATMRWRPPAATVDDALPPTKIRSSLAGRARPLRGAAAPLRGHVLAVRQCLAHPVRRDR